MNSRMREAISNAVVEMANRIATAPTDGLGPESEANMAEALVRLETVRVSQAISDVPRRSKPTVADLMYPPQGTKSTGKAS